MIVLFPAGWLCSIAERSFSVEVIRETSSLKSIMEILPSCSSPLGSLLVFSSHCSWVGEIVTRPVLRLRLRPRSAAAAAPTASAAAVLDPAADLFQGAQGAYEYVSSITRRSAAAARCVHSVTYFHCVSASTGPRAPPEISSMEKFAAT